MADIRPFRAIRYRATDLSALVAPPYDILDDKDKQALLARNDHNVVAIDLPHAPAKSAGSPGEYEAAAREMRRWLTDGVLAADERDSFYIYHQSYTHNGRPCTRKMFFVRLRLEEFGQGQVFPHEQTFGGPKEDRLLLTRATRANLSPIFGLYPDPDNAVAAVLDAATHRDPDATATAEGVDNRLWAVSDEGAVARVRDLMREKPVFIADGHHRYGTGLLYRAELARGGALPADHPAQFVLCCMAGMEDPGLQILPTHRVLYDMPGVTVNALREALHDEFEVAPVLEGKDAGPLTTQLAAHGPQAIAVYAAGDDAGMIFAPKNPDLLAQFEPQRAPAWRRYSLAILHRCVLDEIVTPRFSGGSAAPIHYIKDTMNALSEARAHHGLAFIVQPTTMQELRDICTANELMPQKSTYFYPKLATGMVINPLE